MTELLPLTSIEGGDIGIEAGLVFGVVGLVDPRWVLWNFPRPKNALLLTRLCRTSPLAF